MHGNIISIFRPDATRRYSASQGQTVLPQLVSPPVGLYLWMLLGLLVCGGGIAWFALVPVYVSCPAVVVDWRGRSPVVEGNTAIVVFVPWEDIGRVRSGQKLFVRLDVEGRRFSQQINFVDPHVLNPDAIHRQFALHATAALAVTQPAAVALARFEGNPSGLPASAYVGGVYQVDIEVGVRRLISLLPFGNLFFPEDRV